ncbi:hypothetical protein ACP275_14G322000 [Erythranthe tilingii]
MGDNKSSAAPPKLERSISIQEPKTLTEAELAFFREAALQIINTHSPEEATRIFLGGKETAVATGAKKSGESD